MKKYIILFPVLASTALVVGCGSVEAAQLQGMWSARSAVNDCVLTLEFEASMYRYEVSCPGALGTLLSESTGGTYVEQDELHLQFNPSVASCAGLAGLEPSC